MRTSSASSCRASAATPSSSSARARASRCRRALGRSSSPPPESSAWQRREAHCFGIFASSTILIQVASSPATRSRISSGAVGRKSPIACSPLLTAGTASALRSSALSRSTIERGRRSGPASANQVCRLKPSSASASRTVGTSGNFDDRASAVVASARNFPACTLLTTCVGVANAKSIPAPISSLITFTSPRYVTWSNFAPVRTPRSSPPRWWVEPGPALPKLILPGEFLASAISSASDWNLEPAGTTMKNGMVMTLEIQLKLPTVSNGTDWNTAPNSEWPPGVQERVAVRIAFRHLRGADGAGGAGLVLDHDRLAESARHSLSDQPRHGVDTAAGREACDDLDRTRRIVLRVRRERSGPGGGRQHEDGDPPGFEAHCVSSSASSSLFGSSYAITRLFARPRLAAARRFGRAGTFRCARRGRQAAVLVQSRDPVFPGARHRARLQLIGTSQGGLAAVQRPDLADHHRAQLDFRIDVRIDRAEHELAHAGAGERRPVAAHQHHPM